MAYKVLIIGRNGDQTQRLNDLTVSSAHAELSIADGPEIGYRIRLLKMSNNIWLNGVSVISEECRLSDDIHLGDRKIPLDVPSAINDLRKLNGLPAINVVQKLNEKPVEKMERREVWSNIIVPKPKAPANKPESTGNQFSGLIATPEPQKPQPTNQQVRNLKVKREEQPVPEPDKATRGEIELLDNTYRAYKIFMDKEEAKGILTKIANVVPMVVFVLTRTVLHELISLGVCVILFLLLQIVTAVLTVQQNRESQKRKTKYLARMRNSYICPLSPDKPLFYANSNLPIPFEELEDGICCQLCGQRCKKITHNTNKNG